MFISSVLSFMGRYYVILYFNGIPCYQVFPWNFQRHNFKLLLQMSLYLTSHNKACCQDYQVRLYWMESSFSSICYVSFTELLPSTRPECRFPDEFRRDWYLWEKDRQETVRIQGGRISFTTLGEFICKAKHWSLNDYKLLSYYTNGW